MAPVWWILGALVIALLAVGALRLGRRRKSQAARPSGGGIPHRFPAQWVDVLMSNRGLRDGSTIAFEAQFGHRLDVDRLSRATRLLFDAEPILGCRFVAGWWRACWERLERPGEAAFVSARTAEDFATLRATPIRIDAGPQARVCLHPAPGGDRLLLQVTHEAADGAGLRDVMLLLASLYRRLRAEPDFSPAPNLTGSRSPEQVLRGLSPADLAEIKRRARLERLTSDRAQQIVWLPLEPRPSGRGYCLHQVAPAILEQARRRARAQQASLNDVLVAAFFRAQARLGGYAGARQDPRRLEVRVTSDIRKYLPGGRAQAVCDLAANHVLRLHPYRPDEPFEKTLARVAQLTRRLKQGRQDLAIYAAPVLLRRLPNRWLLRMMTRLDELLTRTGRLVPTFSNAGSILPADFDFEGPMTEAWLLPHAVRLPNFVTAFTTFEGRLTMAAGFVPDAERAMPVAALFTQVEAELAAFGARPG